jgi:hypothetical protein
VITWPVAVAIRTPGEDIDKPPPSMLELRREGSVGDEEGWLLTVKLLVDA